MKNTAEAAETVQIESMAKAGNEEYQLAGDDDLELRDIDVSLDGSRLTRGHSSLIAATSVIQCVTGKLLDTCTHSKVCKSCDHWNTKD
ncbi:hypothetical protein PoB_006392700 [Plakobranchus ocellatus]|uniref:Mutator-like transposase domain-containing protein n=1 Tax=Plakobranchus ocellatus TaxID=259542 RepID=A0AAV4CZV9_9GAST|nr:hypothetical protein PoB_006392700 [Plakobranchus ocellatus]